MIAELPEVKEQCGFFYRLREEARLELETGAEPIRPGRDEKPK